MNKIKLYLKKSSLLTLSQTINLMLSVGLILLISQNLAPGEFGIYAFYFTIITIVSIFIDLGINESVAQYLGEIKTVGEYRLIFGNVYLISLLICILYSTVILMLSFIIDYIFNVKIGSVLNQYWFLLFSVPLYELSKSMCRGANFLWQWSLINILPRLFFIILILYLLYFYELNLLIICKSLAISFIISSVFSILILHPKFNISIHNIRNIIDNIKRFGIYTTIAKSIFNANVYLDRLFISLFLNSEMLGLYQMTISLANPISMFSNSIGTMEYNKYVKEKSINRKTHKINVILLLVQSIVLLFFAPFIIALFDLHDYNMILRYLPYVLIAICFLGLKQPYSFFLLAKKKGKEIQKISIITIIISLTVFLILVPIFDLYGAIFGLIITYFSLWILHIYYYRLYFKN